MHTSSFDSLPKHVEVDINDAAGVDNTPISHLLEIPYDIQYGSGYNQPQIPLFNNKLDFSTLSDISGSDVDVIIFDSSIDPMHSEFKNRIGESRLQLIDWEYLYNNPNTTWEDLRAHDITLSELDACIKDVCNIAVDNFIEAKGADATIEEIEAFDWPQEIETILCGTKPRDSHDPDNQSQWVTPWTWTGRNYTAPSGKSMWQHPLFNRLGNYLLHIVTRPANSSTHYHGTAAAATSVGLDTGWGSDATIYFLSHNFRLISSDGKIRDHSEGVGQYLLSKFQELKKASNNINTLTVINHSGGSFSGGLFANMRHHRIPTHEKIFGKTTSSAGFSGLFGYTAVTIDENTEFYLSQVSQSIIGYTQSQHAHNTGDTTQWPMFHPWYTYFGDINDKDSILAHNKKINNFIDQYKINKSATNMNFGVYGGEDEQNINFPSTRGAYHRMWRTLVSESNVLADYPGEVGYITASAEQYLLLESHSHDPSYNKALPSSYWEDRGTRLQDDIMFCNHLHIAKCFVTGSDGRTIDNRSKHLDIATDNGAIYIHSAGNTLLSNNANITEHVTEVGEYPKAKLHKYNDIAGDGVNVYDDYYTIFNTGSRVITPKIKCKIFRSGLDHPDQIVHQNEGIMLDKVTTAPSGVYQIGFCDPSDEILNKIPSTPQGLIISNSLSNYSCQSGSIYELQDISPDNFKRVTDSDLMIMPIVLSSYASSSWDPLEDRNNDPTRQPCFLGGNARFDDITVPFDPTIYQNSFYPSYAVLANNLTYGGTTSTQRKVPIIYKTFVDSINYQLKGNISHSTNVAEYVTQNYHTASLAASKIRRLSNNEPAYDCYRGKGQPSKTSSFEYIYGYQKNDETFTSRVDRGLVHPYILPNGELAKSESNNLSTYLSDFHHAGFDEDMAIPRINLDPTSPNKPQYLALCDPRLPNSLRSDIVGLVSSASGLEMQADGWIPYANYVASSSTWEKIFRVLNVGRGVGHFGPLGNDQALNYPVSITTTHPWGTSFTELSSLYNITFSYCNHDWYDGGMRNGGAVTGLHSSSMINSEYTYTSEYADSNNVNYNGMTLSQSNYIFEQETDDEGALTGGRVVSYINGAIAWYSCSQDKVPYTLIESDGKIEEFLTEVNGELHFSESFEYLATTASYHMYNTTHYNTNIAWNAQTEFSQTSSWWLAQTLNTSEIYYDTTESRKYYDIPINNNLNTGFISYDVTFMTAPVDTMAQLPNGFYIKSASGDPDSMDYYISESSITVINTDSPFHGHTFSGSGVTAYNRVPLPRHNIDNYFTSPYNFKSRTSTTADYEASKDFGYTSYSPMYVAGYFSSGSLVSQSVSFPKITGNFLMGTDGSLGGFLEELDAVDPDFILEEVSNVGSSATTVTLPDDYMIHYASQSQQEYVEEVIGNRQITNIMNDVVTTDWITVNELDLYINGYITTGSIILVSESNQSTFEWYTGLLPYCGVTSITAGTPYFNNCITVGGVEPRAIADDPTSLAIGPNQTYWIEGGFEGTVTEPQLSIHTSSGKFIVKHQTHSFYNAELLETLDNSGSVSYTRKSLRRAYGSSSGHPFGGYVNEPDGGYRFKYTQSYNNTSSGNSYTSGPVGIPLHRPKRHNWVNQYSHGSHINVQALGAMTYAGTHVASINSSFPYYIFTEEKDELRKYHGLTYTNYPQLVNLQDTDISVEVLPTGDVVSRLDTSEGYNVQRKRHYHKRNLPETDGGYSYYKSFSGTSAASPQVTGVASLIGQLDPTANVTTMIKYLDHLSYKTAIGSLSGIGPNAPEHDKDLGVNDFEKWYHGMWFWGGDMEGTSENIRQYNYSKISAEKADQISQDYYPNYQSEGHSSTPNTRYYRTGMQGEARDTSLTTFLGKKTSQAAVEDIIGLCNGTYGYTWDYIVENNGIVPMSFKPGFDPASDDHYFRYFPGGSASVHSPSVEYINFTRTSMNHTPTSSVKNWYGAFPDDPYNGMAWSVFDNIMYPKFLGGQSNTFYDEFAQYMKIVGINPKLGVDAGTYPDGDNGPFATGMGRQQWLVPLLTPNTTESYYDSIPSTTRGVTGPHWMSEILRRRYLGTWNRLTFTQPYIHYDTTQNVLHWPYREVSSFATDPEFNLTNIVPTTPSPGSWQNSNKGLGSNLELLGDMTFKTDGISPTPISTPSVVSGEITPIISLNNLYTEGSELNLPDETDYIGSYHIHYTHGAMVGAEHTTIPHNMLTPTTTQFSESIVSIMSLLAVGDTSVDSGMGDVSSGGY